ncbi:hypothetical protein JVT61DRAFT_8196 [Boletus reticuloceps]|uniref:DUF6534 domain-containing protein n=1 Tax=Boletus reticuloceps TaxID=495285 RepID=A0A8I2YWT9_9AGAM|nr:hypothetical protein JVT61DRAFT_8196 [Boletus reticuloceps]
MPIPPSLTPLFFFSPFPSPPFPPSHVAYRPSDRIPLPGLYAPHSSVFTGRLTRVRLYGLTMAQTWYYFHSFPKDSCRTKILVAFLSALGTAQIVLVSASIYQYTIVYAGDIDMSGYVTSSFEASMGVSSVIAFGVQLAYAHRIWRLSFCNRQLTVSIVVLAFIALGCGVAILVETIVTPQWQSTRGSNLSAMIFYFSSIACDLLIAGSQAYLFHKSRTGIGRLGGLISKLTILVINVGLLTSADVTVFLVLFLVCPSNGAFLVPYILMSHCYLNSFLSVLNSRLFLRELVDKEEVRPPPASIGFGNGIDVFPSPLLLPLSWVIVHLSKHRKLCGRFRAQSNIPNALTMSIPVSLANTISMPAQAVLVPVLVPIPVRVTTAHAVSI